MRTGDFVAQVRQCVVEDNTKIYRDLFENTSSATDPYWIRAFSLFQALDDEEKGVFFEILRQVAIDSVSNVFAIVDGASQLEGQDGPIQLYCGEDGLAGELQDRFLEQFEE